MADDPRETSIYTIGYGHRSMEEMVALLHRYGIRYLGDVRSRPYSRFNPDFSRDSLQKLIQQHRMTYVFLGDTLGGDPETPDVRMIDGDEDGAYAVDYELARRQPAFRTGMEQLHTAWEQRIPLALMCNESRPEDCHRVRMIGVQLEEDSIPVLHIDETGAVRTHAPDRQGPGRAPRVWAVNEGHDVITHVETAQRQPKYPFPLARSGRLEAYSPKDTT